jgi:putative heme-binding domain-containing protein
VRREIAVLLQHYQGEAAIPVWLDLARKHDPNDRWSLEALGIGAKGKEAAIAGQIGSVLPRLADARRLDLEWRLRIPESLPGLISLMNDAAAEPPLRIRAMEAVAAQTSEQAVRAISACIGDETKPAAVRESGLRVLARRIFSEWTPFRSSLEVSDGIAAALSGETTRKAAVELADELEDSRFATRLAAIASDDKVPEETRILAAQAAGKTKTAEVVPVLDGLLRRGSLPIRMAALRGLGFARPAFLDASLERIVQSKEPNELRSLALRILAGTDRGASRILDLEERQQLPAELRTLGANLLALNRTPSIAARAAKVLPPPLSRTKNRLPPPRSLTARQGDAVSGRRVFNSKQGADCASCHSLDAARQLAGPNLSAIGNKLGKEALLEAILNPSAGIAHEYVTWIVDTKTQGQVMGILSEDTPQRVVLKTDTGETIRLRPGDITGRRKSNLSMMPEDLVSKMTEEQIVDLLEYLTTLREEPAYSRARP